MVSDFFCVFPMRATLPGRCSINPILEDATDPLRSHDSSYLQRKFRLSKVEELVQGHTAGRLQDLNPSSLAP